MTQSIAIPNQIIQPGSGIVFQVLEPACSRGFVRHNSGSVVFKLRGWLPSQQGVCPCRRQNEAHYFVTFGGNIAIPTGETVGPISLAITEGGIALPEAIMTVTPAAVEEYFNVSRSLVVDIFGGCCEDVAVINNGTIPILLQNGVITFDRPDLALTR